MGYTTVTSYTPDLIDRDSLREIITNDSNYGLAYSDRTYITTTLGSPFALNPDSFCITSGKLPEIEKSPKFHCVYCGTQDFEGNDKHTPHCPNCGALMRKAKDND